MQKKPRHPSIIVPYPGSCIRENIQDIAVYLRPESNGVKVESTLLSVIKNNALYRDSFSIVYLANIPGDFIVANRVVEEHYALKLDFAWRGKSRFTKVMAELFETHFRVPFEKAEILGAFQAQRVLKMSTEELFHIWVPHEDMLRIHGQSVKKYRDVYIVNYDIPALIHRNSRETDVFSMILRCTRPYRDIHGFILDCGEALKKEGIITNPKLYSHVFHYSKSPFEQILDGIGYVYQEEDRHVPVEELSFFAYLLSKGCKADEILGAISNPIMEFSEAPRQIREMNLFSYTYEDSFEAAWKKFESRSILLGRSRL